MCAPRAHYVRTYPPPVYLDSTRLVIDEKDGRTLQLTSRDKERFQLLRQADQQARATGDPAVEHYFQELNSKLFEGIASLQEEGIRELTPEMLEERLGMGASDAAFVRELLRQLGLDRVSVKEHARCCFGCGQ